MWIQKGVFRQVFCDKIRQISEFLFINKIHESNLTIKLDSQTWHVTSSAYPSPGDILNKLTSVYWQVEDGVIQKLTCTFC